MRDGFARLPDNVILVFDNYQDVAAESALHAPFKAALAEVPPGSNIIVLSRADPPPSFADALINQTIALVSWEDLRLTAEETSAIAARKGFTDRTLLRTLHEQSSGWMAGVTLMLERLRRGGDLESLHGTETLDTVFDYFAGLIFDHASEETREVLMKTAFLQRVSASLAEAVTGKENAIEHIEELHRRHLFTDRIVGNEITYQYHALFRAFLKSNASIEYSADACRSIARLAAGELQTQSQSEPAFALFVEAEEWGGAERIFIALAPQLLAQGRWQTLSQWVEALPKDRLDANPWIRYWQGRSLSAVRPREAGSILANAFESFINHGLEDGQLLAATGILEALFFIGYDDFSVMDSWLEHVSKLMDAQVRARDPKEELWVQSTFMQAAAYRAPGHPRLRDAVAQVMKLLAQPFDANLRVGAASMLHEYANLPADQSLVRVATTVARPLLDSPQLTSHRAAFYWACEGYTSYTFGYFNEALFCFDKCEAIAAAAELSEAVQSFVLWRGFCERRAGLPNEADITVQRMEKYRAPGNRFFDPVLKWLKAMIAFDRGNFDFAIREGLAARDALEVSGDTMTRILFRMISAYMLAAVERNDEAAVILEECKSYVTGTVLDSLLGAISLLEAWVVHHCGDSASRNDLIRDALSRAHDEGSRARIRWFPKALEELIPVALEQNIEPQMAKVLVRECRLAPPAADIENWPWPLKVHTLGRFELLIDGESPAYSRKVPKKVLVLLKAIIAFDVQQVPEQKLLDALWPNEDGDAARRALTATLHRLRKLLANDNAIRQAGGNITLEERCCWVDAKAYGRRLNRDGGDLKACEAAIPLYRGAFLAHEDAPWVMPMRERLRGKFIHAVGKLGASYEGSERYDSAVDLYVRGIEADNLVEPFYQGLMRCYDKLNRRSEALSTYRRLRETLSITLGVPPSSASQRLFDSLRLH